VNNLPGVVMKKPGVKPISYSLQVQSNTVTHHTTENTAFRMIVAFILLIISFFHKFLHLLTKTEVFTPFILC